MRHTLKEGQLVIDALELLGIALGYNPIREHVVGGSAAVDLSWTAADFNDVPLFVFEVESTASAGLASNAMKVFGRPLESLTKPLFFFHLVVSAKASNERVANAQRTWGSHNYRVYRISDAEHRWQIVSDVLRQHRRVSNRLDVLSVVDAVRGMRWGNTEFLMKMLDLLEELHFDSAYLYALARLAREDIAFLPLFAKRSLALRSGALDASSREGYRGGPGDYIGGLLELALVVAAGEIPDEMGPQAFETWATSAGSFPRLIDAALGLSRDYDGFILGVAPFQYAIACVVLGEHPHTQAWVVRDLYRLLVAEQKFGVTADFLLLGGVWLVHLLGTASRRGVLSDQEVADTYSWFERCAGGAGGIPIDWLESPPSPNSELDQLTDLVSGAGVRVDAKSWEAFAEAAAGISPCEFSTASALEWCLGALIDLDVYHRPTSNLVTMLKSPSRR